MKLRPESSALLALVCLGVGFLLGTWLAERPVADVVVPALPTAGSDVRTAPAEPQLVGREPPPLKEAASPLAPLGPEPVPVSAELAPGVVARLTVTVPLPLGARKLSGQVYALPAGSRGVNDASFLPHAALDSETAVVPLPRAGRWDVGYVGRLGAALVEDVQVAAGDLVPVRITLPAQDSVTVRFETREAADWARGRSVNVGLRTARAPNKRRFPGRGETARWGLTFGPYLDRPTVLAALPTNREFKVTLGYSGSPKDGEGHGLSERCPFPQWKLRLDKEHVRPGGEVLIDLVEQGRLLVA